MATAAFVLRVLPYALSGVPYHTDTWPQLANIQTLLAKTPVPLAPGNGFDQYNIYWPGVTLLGSALTLVVGLPAIGLMPVMAPLVSAASAVLLLVLLRQMGIDVRVAAIASFLFAVSGSEAVISAGVTKEAFAIPLLFVFLILLEKGLRGSNMSSGLALFTFVALLVYHHLTAVVGLSLSIFLVVAYAMRPDTRRRSLTVGAPIVLVSLSFASVYLLWYSYKALNITFGPTDAISILAYEAIATAPLLYSFYRGFRGTRPVAVWMGLIYAGVVAIIGLGSRYTVLVLAPQTPLYAILLVGPYLMAGLLAVIAATKKELLASPGTLFAAFWVLGLMGLEGYAIFGTPGLLSVTFRLWDFVYPGVLVMAAFVISRAYSAGTLPRVLAVVLLVGIASGSAYLLPYTAFSAGPLGGSQRVYSSSDLAAASWVGSNISPSSLIMGDIRYSSLASYYSTPVDVSSGLLVAEGAAPLKGGCFLYNSLMASVGFVALPYGSASVGKSAQALLGANGSSVVFSDGGDQLICEH